MSTPNILLQADQVSKQVTMADQTLTLLQDISLSVHQGHSLAIVGESGSGKSTLLGLLAGLDTPSQGRIRLFDHALEQLTEDERARVRSKHVGFVFQSFQLLPNLTALENVMLPLELAAESNILSRATDGLQAVGLGQRLSHYPKQLSGGEQQRVALARAFVTQPDILFADEPTGNLDTRTGQHIAQQLFDMNASQGTTLVLVTHDAHLASACDRTVIMQAGQLQTDSTS